jgi:hypothetical protein
VSADGYPDAVSRIGRRYQRDDRPARRDYVARYVAAAIRRLSTASLRRRPRASDLCELTPDDADAPNRHAPPSPPMRRPGAHRFDDCSRAGNKTRNDPTIVFDDRWLVRSASRSRGLRSGRRRRRCTCGSGSRARRRPTRPPGRRGRVRQEDLPDAGASRGRNSGGGAISTVSRGDACEHQSGS